MKEITKKITLRLQLFYAAFTLFFSFLLSRLCLDVPRPAFELFGIWFSLETWQIDRVFLPFAALLNFALSQLLRLWYIRRVLRREMAYLGGGDKKHRQMLILWLIWPGELLRLLLYFINRGILFQKSTVILEASLFKETLASWFGNWEWEISPCPWPQPLLIFCTSAHFFLSSCRWRSGFSARPRRNTKIWCGIDHFCFTFQEVISWKPLFPRLFSFCSGCFSTPATR